LLFLAPFVPGDIKYFRIGGGVAPGGGNISNMFSPYTHFLITRQIAQNIVKICSNWPEISLVLECWWWAAPKGGNIVQLFLHYTHHLS